MGLPEVFASKLTRRNAGTGGNRGHFWEGVFLFCLVGLTGSASRLDLFLWDPFFMVCQIGL